ncbi:MAG: chorismate synthase [Christensenellales bacterium]
MSGIWGRNIRISIFGESHGVAIGITLHNLPAGFELDMSEVEREMARRAPGGAFSTTRKEADKVEIVSGIFEGKTTGAPLTGIIYNTNARSKDYQPDVPRPGHSDYGWWVRSQGNYDYRGGGHSSGRITAPLVFAGAVAKQILAKKGVEIGSHILSVKDVDDLAFGTQITECMLDDLNHSSFPLLDNGVRESMQNTIIAAQRDGDSVGGKIQCAIIGMPAGIGNPFFHSLESELSSMLFSIPAVKAVSFGNAEDMSRSYGSEANDAWCISNGKIATKTNNNGGILGGISTGMPIVFDVTIKPTPSIYKQQDSVSLSQNNECKLQIEGRHDPCILVRALPVVEAAAAIVMLDALGD